MFIPIEPLFGFVSVGIFFAGRNDLLLFQLSLIPQFCFRPCLSLFCFSASSFFVSYSSRLSVLKSLDLPHFRNRRKQAFLFLLSVLDGFSDLVIYAPLYSLPHIHAPY